MPSNQLVLNICVIEPQRQHLNVMTTKSANVFVSLAWISLDGPPWRPPPHRAQGGQIWAQSGSDGPKMGQIQDFISDYSTF